MFQQAKIAICEDQKAFIKILRPVIDWKFKEKNISFSLDIFTTGEELLEEVSTSSEKYDVIFFDIDLPGIDGIETARKIRKVDKSCIFIFITSLDEKVYKIFDTGAFDFIRKSYFDYVSKIMECTILLENNKELPISRRKIAEFKKLFYKSA